MADTKIKTNTFNKNDWSMNFTKSIISASHEIDNIQT